MAPPDLLRLRPATVQVATFDKPTRGQEFNGDDNEYILLCGHSCDKATLAAAVSNRQIKVYDRATLAPKGALKGHDGAITSLCYSPDEPALLATSSEDKTVRIWDTRQGRAAATVRQDDEALSCAIGPTTGLLAVGVGDHINFFDARQPGAPLGQYANAHTDLVTKVLFHPQRPTTLVSGSEDGLVCVYDTGVAQADEALATIMNAECPVRDLTFFGAQGDGLAVLNGSEGTSVWHWPSARRVVATDDLRTSCQSWAKTPQFAVQYHYDGDNGRDRLLLSMSDVEGRVAVLEAQPEGALRPVMQLESGHQGLVRCVDMVGDSIVTGGEDARLCLWTPRAAGQPLQQTPPSSSLSSSHGPGPQQPQRHKMKKTAGHFKPY